MQKINIAENGIHMVLEIGDERKIRLLHFSALPMEEREMSEYEKEGFRVVELALSGHDRPQERHGIKYTVTSPGYRLEYESHRDYRNDWGRKIEITSRDPHTRVCVVSHYQFYTGISVVRCHSEVINQGQETQGIEYISSFNLNGIEKEGLQRADEKMYIRYAHNAWHREMLWQTYNWEQIGLSGVQPHVHMRSSKAFHVTNTGNWSTKEHLPMGYLENTETGSSLFWQIEHNGSWHWEISDQTDHYYLQLSGPTENESHWYKVLAPGERFESVPAAVGVSTAGFDCAMGEMTRYRRIIRRDNEDNRLLGVIFNDYMNCLWADPTTEKELPLIDAAAEAGCEYYCIDAGWYAPGYWWDNVGEWLPAHERFPNGLKELMAYIRSKGMVPGLWLEIEVMGICCPKAQHVPPEWFFQRHGKHVYDRSRYQLDFRHPGVVEHANEVLRRLVEEYGVGYIKMDYNIEPGIGTEIDADSFGDGLLEHERAYLAWLDSVFETYPALIIENCSSGGMRIDYALLSRHSIQSTSDQEDYRPYATIAANAPAALTPEQAAVWSYPLREGDREEVVFNMVNALLLRIHQSGHLAELSEERRALVHEAIAYYKSIREDIRHAVPFWPLGLSQFSDGWISLGLQHESRAYVAVWRRDAQEDTCSLPIPFLKGKHVRVRCAYPSYEHCSWHWNSASGILSVSLPERTSARLFEIQFDEGGSIA